MPLFSKEGMHVARKAKLKIHSVYVVFISYLIFASFVSQKTKPISAVLKQYMELYAKEILEQNAEDVKANHYE